jgi:hypothetical protein
MEGIEEHTPKEDEGEDASLQRVQISSRNIQFSLVRQDEWKVKSSPPLFSVVLKVDVRFQAVGWYATIQSIVVRTQKSPKLTFLGIRMESLIRVASPNSPPIPSVFTQPLPPPIPFRFLVLFLKEEILPRPLRLAKSSPIVKNASHTVPGLHSEIIAVGPGRSGGVALSGLLGRH